MTLSGREKRSLIDWDMAGLVARTVSPGSDQAMALDAAAAREAGERALELVLSYTGLRPAVDLPAVEIVSRHDWIASNLIELRELAAPLEAQAAAEISLPGPPGAFLRTGLGAASGAEAGLALGYAARRVLGQYQTTLGSRPKPPRMLLVGHNLNATARELDVDPQRFLLWVAIHEQTHSVQFASVPWLREHLAGLVCRLIAGASGGIDLSRLISQARHVVSGDPRRAIQRALRGELARALAGPEQVAVIDELQATMAVVEGHAEHVMDAASREDGDLARMRQRIDARRARRGGLANVIARILGLGMKLRQYELGKAWADAVASETGIAGLNRVWEDPGALPSAHELEHPGAWIRRVSSDSLA